MYTIHDGHNGGGLTAWTAYRSLDFEKARTMAQRLAATHKRGFLVIDEIGQVWTECEYLAAEDPDSPKYRETATMDRERKEMDAMMKRVYR